MRKHMSVCIEIPGEEIKKRERMIREREEKNAGFSERVTMFVRRRVRTRNTHTIKSG